MNHLSLKCAAMALAFAASAQAFTVTGKVSDESGKAIEKASVELLKNALKTTTDSKGEFKIFKDETIGLHAARPMLGYVSVMNGVLSYSQSTNEPVRIQVFDAVGSRVLNETVYGTGTLDMQSIVKSQGSYFARVSVGSAKSNFRFTSNGNYGISFGEAVARGLKKEEAGDELRVIATDYDTLTVGASRTLRCRHVVAARIQSLTTSIAVISRISNSSGVRVHAPCVSTSRRTTTRINRTNLFSACSAWAAGPVACRMKATMA